MSRRVQHLLSALRKFKQMKNKNNFLKSCNTEFIHGVCECIRNLLKGRIPIKSNHLKCLTRHKQTLRKLALKKTSLVTRKKIMQKGGFLGALITPLITGLASLLGGYMNTSNAAR
jgi:hypothetical protein